MKIRKFFNNYNDKISVNPNDHSFKKEHMTSQADAEYCDIKKLVEAGYNTAATTYGEYDQTQEPSYKEMLLSQASIRQDYQKLPIDIQMRYGNALNFYQAIADQKIDPAELHKLGLLREKPKEPEAKTEPVGNDGSGTNPPT